MDSGSPQSAGDPAPSNGQPPNNSDNADQDFGFTELMSFIHQREAAGETVSVDMIRNFIEELCAAEKTPRDDLVKESLEQIGLCQVLRNEQEKEFEKKRSMQQTDKPFMDDIMDQIGGLRDPGQKQQLFQEATNQVMRLHAITAEVDKATDAAMLAMLVLQRKFGQR